jgi:hypothetical protein
MKELLLQIIGPKQHKINERGEREQNITYRAHFLPLLRARLDLAAAFFFFIATRSL